MSWLEMVLHLPFATKASGFNKDFVEEHFVPLLLGAIHGNVVVFATQQYFLKCGTTTIPLWNPGSDS